MPIAIDDTSASIEWPACRESDDSASLNPVVPDEWEEGAPGLKSIYSQLAELSQPDSDEEDFVAPTEYAIARLIDVVSPAAYRMMAAKIEMPDGRVITDYHGGLRIEWWSKQKYCVTLAIGHDRDAKSYTFVKIEDDGPGFVNERTLSIRLASQLKALKQK